MKTTAICLTDRNWLLSYNQSAPHPIGDMEHPTEPTEKGRKQQKHKTKGACLISNSFPCLAATGKRAVEGEPIDTELPWV